MTLKQKRFVQEYVKNGGNGTKAALKVYNTSNQKYASVQASRLISNDSVKASIDDIAKSRGIDSTFILDNFKDIAVKQVEKVSADAKLKANIELARILGLYPGTKHASLNINLSGKVQNMDFKQVKEELKIIDDDLNSVLNDEPITEKE